MILQREQTCNSVYGHNFSDGCGGCEEDEITKEEEWVMQTGYQIHKEL